MGNMTRLGLQQKEQIAVFLCLFVVWKSTLLDFGIVFQMAGNFFALFGIRQWGSY
jgi:hypothetical protein